MTAADPPPAVRPGFLRRAWPWLVGIAILAFIATRIPLDTFRDAVSQGPHLLMAGVNLALILVVLCTDSVSTWIGLIALRMRRPLGAVCAARGATYVLLVVNYAVGQGGFGYYLHRTGTTPLRAVGATLFLIGTNLAALLVMTSIAWLFRSSEAHASLGWTLLAGCIALVLYLVVIVLQVGFLARREVLAPLFDAGLRGHALAILGRVPHNALIILGHWIAIRAWGIEVPFEVGMTLMPAVAIISVLPISPAGLGTTQAAMVYFFSEFAAGGTVDERQATVLAFGIVYFVYGIIASVLVGLVCMPFAKRISTDVVSPP